MDRLVLLLAGAVVVEAGVTWVARRSSFVLSERVFARLREDFVASAVRLPLSTVERAGTGDLLARTTNDVDAISYVIRFGVPTHGRVGDDGRRHRGRDDPHLAPRGACRSC